MDIDDTLERCYIKEESNKIQENTFIRELIDRDVLQEIIEDE